MTSLRRSSRRSWDCITSAKQLRVVTRKQGTCTVFSSWP
ncbi:unnamed protein product [Brassica rapa]|uniref:Uncharacterized protein n=1 Tax=Brassica campestris TaxID=3711 RepID=A0A3P5YSG6_BRACM|nr:unnamed protein product [Brassica rapa]VDC70692.1 unnamed protein product [Brassica rapa]